MKRFKKILVVPAKLEEGDASLVRALQLAKSNDATLTIAWLVEEPDADGNVVENVYRELAAGATKRLADLVSQVSEDGLSISGDLIIGRPFIEIIQRVLSKDFDLVIKTARGRQMQRRVIFGTTALHLLRKCPAPVWIVDPDSRDKPGGVIAAIDTQTEDPKELALNTKIMELATSLSMLEDRDLHFVHAWSAPYQSMVRQSPLLKISKEEADDYVRLFAERHRGPFQDMLARFKEIVPATNPHLIEGPAADVIPSLADELQAEVIVMATVARTGIPGMFIGNTAEAVITQVDCSVLAIKPDGFVSPVDA